jgi:hypothetical protein
MACGRLARPALQVSLGDVRGQSLARSAHAGGIEGGLEGLE